MPTDNGVEIVGPFQQRELVVDGWTVPLVNAIEVVGGRVHFTLDRRFGFDVAVADFDQMARMLATGIALALGLPCHPQGDLLDDERVRLFAHITQPSLAPRRLVGIGNVETETEDEAGLR